MEVKVSIFYAELFCVLFIIMLCICADKFLNFKMNFLPESKRKKIELELFEENEPSLLEIKPVQLFKKITQKEKLKELKDYYIDRTKYFDEQYRDFLHKVNLYFQMYIFSWGYFGAAAVFLLTGNGNKPFETVSNPSFLICVFSLIILHLYFFYQVLNILCFTKGYKTDKDNFPFKYIAKSEIEYLKAFIKNKAYFFNCNSLLLENMKIELKNTPVKFIIILLLVTIHIITVVVLQRSPA